LNDSRRFLVSGRVQGVGFRYSATHRARRLGLCGFVRNLEDGRVETVVQGEASAIQAYREWLAEGPAFARVDGVSEAPLPDDTPRFSSFSSQETY
jgi:acylphosphatase